MALRSWPWLHVAPRAPHARHAGLATLTHGEQGPLRVYVHTRQQPPPSAPHAPPSAARGGEIMCWTPPRGEAADTADTARAAAASGALVRVVRDHASDGAPCVEVSTALSSPTAATEPHMACHSIEGRACILVL